MPETAAFPLLLWSDRGSPSHVSLMLTEGHNRACGLGGLLALVGLAGPALKALGLSILHFLVQFWLLGI